MHTVSNRPAPIRILIAVSVRLYREGLAASLKAHSSLLVAATAATGHDTLIALRNTEPDVVIVDVSLDSALDLIRTLRAEHPSSAILAFAVRDNIAAVLEYAEAGAHGFVTPNCTVAELVEAIERTVAGELLCSPRLAAQLLRRAAHGVGVAAGQTSAGRLTSREEQVFSLLRQGHSNKEIASTLRIAEATVKNHVHRVLEKLQVATRGQAAATLRAQVKPTTEQSAPILKS